jgi:hypothetical protein
MGGFASKLGPSRIEAKHCAYTELGGKVTDHDDAKEIGIQSDSENGECKSQHATMVRESNAKSAQLQGELQENTEVMVQAAWGNMVQSLG